MYSCKYNSCYKIFHLFFSYRWEEEDRRSIQKDKRQNKQTKDKSTIRRERIIFALECRNGKEKLLWRGIQFLIFEERSCTVFAAVAQELQVCSRCQFFVNELAKTLAKGLTIHNRTVNQLDRALRWPPALGFKNRPTLFHCDRAWTKLVRTASLMKSRGKVFLD